MGKMSKFTLDLPQETPRSLTVDWWDRGDFVMHFQPQVRVHSALAFGCEALLRVRGTDGAITGPGEVLTSIEQAPAAERLRRHRQVLQLALASALDAHASTGLEVSVNVPPELFGDAQSLAWLLHFGTPGITLEVLETGAPDVAAVNHAIRELHAAGYKVALDDFGAGFASASLLFHLDGLDYAKVDRLFLMDHSRTGRSVFTSLCSIIRARGIQLFAEGIEEPDDHQACLAAGVDYAQGYLYGRAVALPGLILALYGVDVPDAGAPVRDVRGATHGQAAQPL